MANDPDAILLAWQYALEGGNAIADVVSSKMKPSGKLILQYEWRCIYIKGQRAAGHSVISVKNYTGRRLFMREHLRWTCVGYRYYNTFNVKP